MSIPDSLRSPEPEIYPGTRKADGNLNPVTHCIDADHQNIYSFLGVAQQYGVEFMPIAWEPGRDGLGIGASGQVNQSLVDIRTSLAFKRFRILGDDSKKAKSLLKSWITEMVILRSPGIRDHPNIIHLEGVAWEVDPVSLSASPVLVYKRGDLGSLGSFLSQHGSDISFEQKVAICVGLAAAVDALHERGNVNAQS